MTKARLLKHNFPVHVRKFKKHINKSFKGLSRDLGGILFMCFLFSQIRNEKKKQKQLFGVHPVPGVGTIPQICLCLCVFYFPCLVTRPKYPPYRETGVAMPLSHCVSCGIADYRCYTPTSSSESGLSQSKGRPNKGVSQKKLVSEAHRAIGGVARNSIANRAIVGH